MAKSCGIHIDQGQIHLVALDGGPKKHRVVAQLSGALEGEDPGVAAVAFLKAAAKKHKLSGENVGLVADSGQAAFRRITLPFDDRKKIEEVLKFEVESDFPQWNIEDVVVDFLVTETKPGVESHLVVTAVQKDRLASQLAACQRAGLEAFDAELDGSALFDAAAAAGVLTEDTAQVLLHVGQSSTTVVVADGLRLREMRAIRAGAVAHSQVSGATPDEPLEEPQEAEDPTARAQRARESVARIRRELVRTLSGARTANPIEAIHWCGQELEGLADGEFEVPVERLDVVPPGSDRAIEPECVVAYGSALRRLGGGLLEPHLRREELRFSGTLERLELPLAVFALLLFFTLLVQWVVLGQQLTWRDAGDPEVGIDGDLQIWLKASNGYMFPNPEKGYPGRLQNPPTKIQNFARRAEAGEIEDKTKFEQLDEIRKMLLREIDQLQRETGQVSEVVQPQSALQGATLVLGVLHGLGDQVGRFGVRSVGADYVAGRGGSTDYIQVKLDLDFVADNSLGATDNYTAFVNAVQAQPWCVKYDRKPTKVLDDGKGIYVDGITIQVDTTKAVQTPEGGEGEA